MEVHFDVRGEREEDLEDQFAQVAGGYTRWFDEITHIETDNQLFNEVLRRSLTDMRILWANDGEGGEYPAAGTPWFDALFGRDSCIAALQMLPYRPEIARNVLLSLAARQGKEENPDRDEEPGKILHELRRGEMATSGELPFAPYYGSVDSTPLFLILAHQYWQWTADRELIERLKENILQALTWMQVYGDPRGEGWLAYEKRSPRGLVNQGWKDSWDAILHTDGTIPEAPIALCEAQGYAYAALRGASDLLRCLGEEHIAGDLLAQADDLRDRFHPAFWLDDEGYYALALDGDGQPVASITSNPGQALWTGIVSDEHRSQVASRLVASDLFTGWGVRTMSSRALRYNPYGYHLGTVWPHDNSLVAAGLKKCGFEGEANMILTGLFEAAQDFEYFRLPELFGGADRAPHQKPVEYPVACKPQAWAAGSVPMILAHVLGLAPDAERGRLNVVNPRLPEWLNEVTVNNMRVGEATADISYMRQDGSTQLQVTNVRGDLEVAWLSKWPWVIGRRS